MTGNGGRVAEQTPPLTIWAVSDGRAGIEGQVVGMAEALARQRKAQVEIKRVGWQDRTGRLPWFLVPFPKRWLTPESGIEPPWPDVMVAAGRATLPVSMRMRRWSKKQTFVVQLQDPRCSPRHFDVVVPPRHDRLSGDNVIPITGAPHRVTKARRGPSAGASTAGPTSRCRKPTGRRRKSGAASTLPGLGERRNHRYIVGS